MGFGAGNAVALKERLLQSAMVVEAPVLELGRVRVREIELQALADDHRLAVAHAVQAPQAPGGHPEPFGVMPERLRRLHLDGLVGQDRVVAGVGRQIRLRGDRLGRRNLLGFLRRHRLGPLDLGDDALGDVVLRRGVLHRLAGHFFAHRRAVGDERSLRSFVLGCRCRFAGLRDIG